MECLPILQKFACFLCQCILDVKSFGRVRLFATPWTVAHQAPPSMEFSRQEYWTGLPFPTPGDLHLLALYQKVNCSSLTHSGNQKFLCDYLFAP